MEKTRIIIVVISLFFLSTQISFAESGTIKWTENNPDDTVNYSKSYTYKGCSVNVFKNESDGSGVNIKTTDGVYVQDIIIIKSSDDGTVLKFEEYYKMEIKNGETNLTLCEKPGDIFLDKYIVPAKGLPEEVKELFFGQYNF